MPYILYKFAHDNRIPNLIQDLQNTKPFNEIRDDKLGDIHIYLQVNIDFNINFEIKFTRSRTFMEVMAPGHLSLCSVIS